MIRTLLKNVSYTITSNALSLLISVVTLLIIPRYISTTTYGEWQLFLFYVSYLGIFHLGWADGIYLRYAGCKQQEINSVDFRGQLSGIAVLQVFFTVLLFVYYSFHTIDNTVNEYILVLAGTLLLLVNINNVYSLILQATNQIKRYAILNSISRIVFFVIIVAFILSGINTFMPYYVAYTISIFVVFLLGCYYLKDILVGRLPSFSIFLKEFKENIVSGFQLMVSNLSSMLILGIIRYGISISWDIVTFGMVSLSINLSNVILSFISAVAIAIFPIVKKIRSEDQGKFYLSLRSLLMWGLLLIMPTYYIIRYVLSFWLPQYEMALYYMGFIFPICLYESKVQILANTFFKSIRSEGLMLKINAGVVFLSVVLTFIGVEIYHNIQFMMYVILIVYVIRSIVSDVYLSKYYNIGVWKDSIIELFFVIVFLFDLNTNAIFPEIVYVLVYCAFLYLHRNGILSALKHAKNI